MTCSATALVGFEIPRGSSASWTISVVNPDGTIPDLTNAKLWFTVKQRYDDVTGVVTKRSAASGGGDAQFEILTQSGTTKGKARVKVVPSDTMDLQVGAYWCDGWYEAQDGTRIQIVPDQPFVIGQTVTTKFT